MTPTRYLRHAGLVLALGASAIASSRPARAAAPVDAEAAGEQAAKFFRQGNTAFEQKKWPEAETAYLQAWRLARTFDVAANLGEVMLQLHRPREAARYLAFSVRSAPPSAKAPQRERTKHFLEETKKEVGTVVVRVNLPDARVTIDGSPVEPSELPFELFVDAGAHTIVAQHDGYLEARSHHPGEPRCGERGAARPASKHRSGGASRRRGCCRSDGRGARGRRREQAQHLTEPQRVILGDHHSCTAGASNFDRAARSSTTPRSAPARSTMLASASSSVQARRLSGRRPISSESASTPSRAVRVTPTVSGTSAGVVFTGSF